MGRAWLSDESIAGLLKKIPLISGMIDEKTFGQFKRYVITGLVSFSIEYLLFTLLYKVIGLWYILSNTIVYIVIFFFNFTLNRKWAFKSKARLGKQILQYGLLFVFNLLAINGLLYLLSDMAGLDPMISKILVMGAVVCWNFVIYKKVIYKN